MGIVDYADPESAGLVGMTGALVASAGGVGGGAFLLALGRRPVKKEAEEPTA